MLKKKAHKVVASTSALNSFLSFYTMKNKSLSLVDPS